MKRILIGICAFLSVAAGCEKEPCTVCAEAGSMRHISLHLTGSSQQTKVLDVPSLSESNVVRCDLFVFDRDGAMVDRYRSTDGRFDFYLTDETYDFVAVANKSDLPDRMMSESELLSSLTTLAENAVGNFVMVGRLAGHRIESDETLTVEVQRRVAKVSYSIHTALPGDLAEAGFRIEDIYLTNVSGACALDGTPHKETSLWYNKMDLEGTASAEGPYALLSGHIGQSMTAADHIASGHVFYPYPNDLPDSRDKTRWEGRCTRFVVRAVLGGRTTWYPVTLEEVRANCHYHIDLTITNFGVEHPEDPLSDYTSVRIAVTADDWTEGGSLEGNY